MSELTEFKVGDRVRHAKRPEWGIGLVQRSEAVHSSSGRPAQRLLVRFPNAGLKTLSTLGAQLEVVTEPPANGVSSNGADTLVDRETAGEGGWLGEISKSKPEDAMVELPEEATDPFRPVAARLRSTLSLYRFSPSGASLIDWAVARSGLADPLSRFTRHELEEFFKRWAMLRDKQLARVVEESRREVGLLERELANAPKDAVDAVKRINTPR